MREKLAAHGMTLEEFDAEMAHLRAGYSQFNVEYIERYIDKITEALAKPRPTSTRPTEADLIARDQWGYREGGRW